MSHMIGADSEAEPEQEEPAVVADIGGVSAHLCAVGRVEEVSVEQVAGHQRPRGVQHPPAGDVTQHQEAF